MSSLPFIKMQGIGNDFIVIDGVSISPTEFSKQKKLITAKFAEEICDRRFGVGADQILWIKPPRSKEAVAEMVVLNADGSTAEMCGNGIRAVGIYLNGLKTPASKKKSQSVFKIDTGAGLLTVEVRGDQVRVDMGTPKFDIAGGKPEKLELSTEEVVSFHSISMGNPHAVILVKSLESYPADHQGPELEVHSRFPQRTNVEFVQVISPKKIRVKVWERGSGFTLACGTGACAAAVAAISSKKVKSPVEVELPGGSLKIEWSGNPDHSVFMSGPAEEVFRGEY